MPTTNNNTFQKSIPKTQILKSIRFWTFFHFLALTQNIQQHIILLPALHPHTARIERIQAQFPLLPREQMVDAPAVSARVVLLADGVRRRAIVLGVGVRFMVDLQL